MRSDEDNSCPCGDRLDLAGPRSYRVRDYSDADLESDMGMTVSHKAALLIGLAYLACAVSVALYPRSLWDIGTFLALIVAANFLIVVGFGPILSGESRSNGKRTN